MISIVQQIKNSLQNKRFVIFTILFPVAFYVFFYQATELRKHRK